MPGQPHPGPVVAVTGSEGELARRVGEALPVRALDVRAGDLAAQLEGATCLVHLAPEPPERPALTLEQAHAETAVVRGLLEAAAEAEVEAVVLLSSAVVHGAWPDNPVPLTESAPVRPVPGFPFAARCAEVERLAASWAGEGSRRAVVLRPAPVVGAGPGLAAALRLGWPVRWAEDEPPVQLLHVDDLAGAVVLAATSPLDGPYGVAPDGWLEPAAVRALAGSPPAVPVPGRVRAALARRSLGDVPAGILAHAASPWVLANDRLRAAGWAPSSTSEEAYVATHPGAPWSRISPRRRQDLILAAAATALVGLPVAVAAAVRRRRRRLGASRRALRA